MSLCLGISVSLFYGAMLQYYSSRVIRDMYLKNDGKTVRIEFFNAYLQTSQVEAKIIDIGYLEPSRVYNLHYSKHKLNQKMYINFKKNIYKHPEYKHILQNIFQGNELLFPQARVAKRKRNSGS